MSKAPEVDISTGSYRTKRQATQAVSCLGRLSHTSSDGLPYPRLGYASTNS